MGVEVDSGLGDRAVVSDLSRWMATRQVSRVSGGGVYHETTTRGRFHLAMCYAQLISFSIKDRTPTAEMSNISPTPVQYTTPSSASLSQHEPKHRSPAV